MKWLERFYTAFFLALLVLAAALAVSGCMNLGGGRQAISLPFSAPNFAMDSQGVAQKNSKAAGAEFAGAGGTAAQADEDTLAGQADQIVQVGGDASLARTTDASLADDQSQAQGKQSGDQSDTGTKTQDRRMTPTVNVGPGGGAAVDVQNTPVPRGDDGAYLEPLPVGPLTPAELEQRELWLARELERTRAAREIVAGHP